MFESAEPGSALNEHNYGTADVWSSAYVRLVRSAPGWLTVTFAILFGFLFQRASALPFVEAGYFHIILKCCVQYRADSFDLVAPTENILSSRSDGRENV